MWFPFTPGFSSSAPICVCGYQPKCGSRTLGGAALPCLMALKGLCSAKFMVTTLFLLHASCRLLCWGDAAPDMRLFSCFGAAVLPGGLLGAMGEDTGRVCRAALAWMLAAFHPLCGGLPTSATGNRRRRVCTPQHATANTNRGSWGASICSLLHVLLCHGGVWNSHPPRSPFHRCFFPLLAASGLALSAGYLGSQHPVVPSSNTGCRHHFSEAGGTLTKAEGLAAAAGGDEF